MHQQQITVDPVVAGKLNAVKQQTQAHFQVGNFDGSVKSGFDALEIAKLLPEPIQSIETIQILLNLSTAFLQLGKFPEADTQSIRSVEIAERAVPMRNNHPQAIDMLSATLTTRAFVLLNLAKLDDAEKVAKRAQLLANQIFQPHDPRFFKAYRCLGLIYARQEKLEEAETFLRKAYDVTCGVNGPANSDAQVRIILHYSTDLIVFLLLLSLVLLFEV